MSNPVCPQNCAYDLPAVSYNNCAPKVQQSQIRRLFVGKANAAAFADWTQEAEWLTRCNQNTTTGDDYIRVLTVTGEKPAPKNITKIIDNGFVAQIGKDHTVNYTTYQVTDDNYEFMRGSECGTLVRLFAFETMGGAFFGTNKGQLVSNVMDSVLAGGDDDVETLTGSMTWRAKFSPERIALSPIFDVDFNLTPGDGGGVVYDTIQLFDTEASVTSEGITTTLPGTDPDAKFEFNRVVSAVGSPQTMNLAQGIDTVAVVDFPADYLGATWRFTNDSGVVFQGVFTAGTIVLS